MASITVTIPDPSQWSENRFVARNRIEKSLSVPRVFANQAVHHFSEAACEAIADAAEENVRDLVNRERSRLEKIALKDHQTEVQGAFALAAVTEVARGTKTPEELAKIVIDTQSVDVLIELFDELDVDSIDRIAAIGNRLTAACDAVREKRTKPEPKKPPANAPKPKVQKAPPQPKPVPPESETSPEPKEPEKAPSDVPDSASEEDDATE